uniref:Uncharacterized protein n=1 Tax=Arundo donax TaxID=35708 RepID=A0A0A9EWU6_ARUDO
MLRRFCLELQFEPQILFVTRSKRLVWSLVHGLWISFPDLYAEVELT